MHWGFYPKKGTLRYDRNYGETVTYVGFNNGIKSVGFSHGVCIVWDQSLLTTVVFVCVTLVTVSRHAGESQQEQNDEKDGVQAVPQCSWIQNHPCCLQPLVWWRRRLWSNCIYGPLKCIARRASEVYSIVFLLGLQCCYFSFFFRFSVPTATACLLPLLYLMQAQGFRPWLREDKRGLESRCLPFTVSVLIKASSSAWDCCGRSYGEPPRGQHYCGNSVRLSWSVLSDCLFICLPNTTNLWPVKQQWTVVPLYWIRNQTGGIVTGNDLSRTLPRFSRR